MKSKKRSTSLFLASVAIGVGLVCSGHLSAQQFSYQTFTTEIVDIPGIAFGKNSLGQNSLSIGAYCSFGCSPFVANIDERDPINGISRLLHSPPAGTWGSVGPAGLAADPARPGVLWVAGYSSRTIFEVQTTSNGNSTLLSSFPTNSIARPIGGLAFDGQSLWVCFENDEVRQMTTSGATLAIYPGNPWGGLDYANGYLFAVNIDGGGRIEVRNPSNYVLVTSYGFPPAGGSINSSLGDIGVDPETGNAYWGRRSFNDIYKLHIPEARPVLACRLGNVNVDAGSQPVGVLSVNGSAGVTQFRTVTISRATTLAVRLARPPQTTANPTYAVWMWRSAPDSTTHKILPFGLGEMCMNPLLNTCGSRCPVFSAMTVPGFCNQVRCSTFEATGLAPPNDVLRIPPFTFSVGERLWVQGVVKDMSDTSGRRTSVTNGIEIHIVP